VLVQTGAYAGHQCIEVRYEGNKRISVAGPRFAVRLAPATGAHLDIRMNRYANTPSLGLPWQTVGRPPRSTP